MTDTLTVVDRVRKIVAEHLCIELEKVTDEAGLLDDLGADSLDIVELSVAIEEEFDVCISDDAIDAWRTAGDLIKTVEGMRVG